jgi:hypothetical protein
VAGLGIETRWWCPSFSGDTSSLIEGVGGITLGGNASVLVDDLSGSPVIAMNGNGGGSFPHTSLITSNCSLSYWLRLTGGDFTFFFHTLQSGSHGIYSQVTWRWRSLGRIVHVPSTSLSVWRHFIWSWTSNVLTFYVDGLPITVVDPGEERNTSISFLNSNLSGGKFESWLRYDDLRVLSRGVTDEEALLLWNDGVPGFGLGTTGNRLMNNQMHNQCKGLTL